MIKCVICDKQMNSISWKHLVHHDMTVAQYKQQFPTASIRSAESEAKHKAAGIARNVDRKGITRSQEVIDKMIHTKSLNTNPSKLLGKPKTEEHKLALSVSKKLAYDSGAIVHWNLGNTTSQDTKHKISETLSNQNRTYSQESKNKRNSTIDLKKKTGWIHPSVLRKGIPSNLSPGSRERIRQGSINANKIRTQNKLDRITAHLTQFDIDLVHIDSSKIYLLCNVCNTSFIRTVGTTNPWRYSSYNGQYCPNCFPPISGIFTLTYFNNHPDQQEIPATLYLVEVVGPNTLERFCKVGITTRTVASRFYAENVGYTFTPVLTVESTLYSCYLLEQEIVNQFKQHCYIPQMEFGGKSECFLIDQIDRIAQVMELNACPKR